MFIIAKSPSHLIDHCTTYIYSGVFCASTNPFLLTLSRRAGLFVCRRTYIEALEKACNVDLTCFESLRMQNYSWIPSNSGNKVKVVVLNKLSIRK